MPTNDESGQVDLGTYRWKKRLVLVFAASAEDSSYQRQKNEFEGKLHELADRDIIVIELPKSGKSTIGEQPLTDKQQSFLRGEFKVPVGDFAFILIGKDGTVKLRSNQTVLSGDIFALIDSMPMRREEMRRKASKSRIQD